MNTDEPFRSQKIRVHLCVSVSKKQSYATPREETIMSTHPETSSTSARPDPFYGEWALDPTQSQYELGNPPASGLYRLAAAGDAIAVTMIWDTVDGQHFEQRYEVIPDGKDYPYDSSAVDALMCALVDPVTLDTTAKKNGQIVAHGRRTLSADGQTMTIVQSGQTPQGQSFRNLSVYRRKREG
jgi:hypothetical protein